MLSASRRVSSARLTRTPCSGAFVALPAAAWRTQDPAPGDNFPVLPYRSDGKRDPSFGNGGKVSTGSAGESDTADSVTVATDGRIVMAGTSVGAYDGDDFAAARCTGGKRDSAFGTGGTVSTDFGSKAGHGNAVASRPPRAHRRRRLRARPRPGREHRPGPLSELEIGVGVCGVGTVGRRHTALDTANQAKR